MGISRRDFVASSAGFLVAAQVGAPAAGAAVPQVSASGAASSQLIEDLVTASHILANEGVLDAYGHASVRHDKNPNRYLISQSQPPDLVTAESIMELDLDSNPIDPKSRKPYLEIFIHGEIYKARPDVQAIVHCHSFELITFGIVEGAELKPACHVASFVGLGVPVFDIREAVGPTDMLVTNPKSGAALARTLGSHPAVLMRGHGGVITGLNVSHVVGRSVYLQINARIQREAMAMGTKINYLDNEEARLREAEFAKEGYSRAWQAWKRRVQRA